MKVCIDAGHGGKDNGAVGLDAKEKDIALSISLKLERLLKKHGHSVILTRRKDTYLTLNQRSDLANRHKVDVFISIHCNGAFSFRAEGIETFCSSSESRLSTKYRKQVQNELIKAFPTHKNRGEKAANFSVLRKAKMPAILVECEFITNPSQEAFLTNGAVQQVLAEAICNGIIRKTEEKHNQKKQTGVKKAPVKKRLTWWQRVKEFLY